MPQYFSGANPENAFATGMMAGYDFIDRIKARNEQIRLQKRNEDRSDQLFTMQQEAHGTQQIAAKLNIEDARGDMADEASERLYRNERRPIEQAKADVLYGQAVESGGLQNENVRGAIQERKNLQRGRDAYGNLIESVGSAPATLGAIGAQGTQGTQSTQVGAGTVLKPGAETPAPTTTAKPNAAPAAAPKPVIDLRALQKQSDAEPNFIQRGVKALTTSMAEGQAKAGERNTRNAWSEVANPELGGNSRVLLGEKHESIQIREIRSNPVPYAPAYLRDRDKVDPADRPAIDATMLTATTERRNSIDAEMKQLDPSDPANKPKIAALRNQRAEADGVVSDLSKAMAKSVGSEILPNGGTASADDPAVLAGVTKAKQAQDASGVMAQVTEQSLRLSQTQLGRMDNPSRLNKQQLGWLAEAFRTGAIDQTTYSNWLQYGGPLQPAKPQIIPFGAGKGVVLYPNGTLAEIDFGTGGKNGKGSKDKDDGAGFTTFAQSMDFMKDTLNARIKKGDIPDGVEGTGVDEMGKMMLLLQRHAPQFQKQNPEVEIFDENGEMSMEWSRNPVDALKVINFYVDVLNGIESPDETQSPIPNAEAAAQIIPTTPWAQ